MDLGIEGKVALVTGAATGIGEATAVELLDEGAVVVLTDKDSKRLEKTAEQYKRHDAFKGRVFSYAADQTEYTRQSR